MVSAGFDHGALLYDGMDEFLDGVVPFVADGVRSGERVMVAVGPRKTERLRSELGPLGDPVIFVPMHQVGRNPARIIPAWRDFVERNRGAGPIRGVGEPIWADRGADELVECQLHESLLNVAFADAPGMRLLCPYDTGTLSDEVIHEARCSHASIHQRGHRERSAVFREGDPVAPFAVSLPRPPTRAEHLSFDFTNLREMRHAVSDAAERAGIERPQRDDLVLAVSEIAANSLWYGGGRGILRIWPQEGGLVCEIRDRGHITDPLVGRERPAPGQIGGWGVWIANQVCDLVQLRSGPDGTVVRLHATSA